MLLAHFYLDLNEANAPEADGLHGSSEMSDLRFSRVVGSLAGSIVYAGDPALGGTAYAEQYIGTEDDLGVERRYHQSPGASTDATTLLPSSDPGTTGSDIP